MHTFLIIMQTAYCQITQVTGIETPIKCSQYIQYFICEEIHISYLGNRDRCSMNDAEIYKFPTLLSKPCSHILFLQRTSSFVQGRQKAPLASDRHIPSHLDAYQPKNTTTQKHLKSLEYRKTLLTNLGL